MAELLEYSGAELIEKLNKGEISVLESLGAHKLKKEMKAAGFFCKLLADYICLPKKDDNLRKRAANVLKLVTPADKTYSFPQMNEAVIIGFNHPSLGEIFRLLLLAFDSYQDKEYLFPVNLPWYEAITGIIPKLARLGIRITPMITPSTEKKLKELCKDDNDRLQQIQHFKVVFERRYMRSARDAAESGSAIFVAPSATRQKEVIGDHIHPTMTILAHMVYRNPETKAAFIPVTVIEPQKNNRGMNLFKKYTICPCESFERKEVEAAANKTRDFDYLFLQRIDAKRKEFTAE